jgi:hypothetical protein
VPARIGLALDRVARDEDLGAGGARAAGGVGAIPPSTSIR